MADGPSHPPPPSPPPTPPSLNDAGTNYEDGFKRAFKMADTSYAENYDSGCQTVYVFLTGERMLLPSREHLTGTEYLAREETASLPDRLSQPSSNLNPQS